MKSKIENEKSDARIAFPRPPSLAPRPSRSGFTLIEVLVVVAIIALLVAILIPTLMEAKDQGRCAKCLANLRDLGTGVNTFASSHKGRFQVTGNVATAADVQNDPSSSPPGIGDLNQDIYAYEIGTGRNPPNLLGWPIVLAREAGTRSMKKNIDFGVLSGPFGANVVAGMKLPKVEQLVCPAAHWNLNTFGLPTGTGTTLASDYVYGYLTYSINNDIVGTGTKACWKDGIKAVGSTTPGAGDALRGRLEKTLRPAEVVLLTDGGIGNTTNPSNGLGAAGAPVVFGSGGPNNGQTPRAPFVEWVDTAYKAKLRPERHRRGSLNFTFADGHGGFSKRITSRKYNPTGIEGNANYPLCPVWEFLPKARVSPYNVGVYPAPP